MKTLGQAFAALRAFLRGFVGATQLGVDPKRALCEHGQRHGRCC
jgi:hypothetical protein